MAATANDRKASPTGEWFGMTSETPAAQRNPLRNAIATEKQPDPCAMVVFGASGDLTKRKLIPALYHLATARKLPAGFCVVGVSNTTWSNEEFRSRMREAVDSSDEVDDIQESVWSSFAEGLFYLPGNSADLALYSQLSALLTKLDEERSAGGNRLFYLATPPRIFIEIIEGLGNAGLARADRGTDTWKRVIIEKPFGSDLNSASELNRVVTRVFDEDDTYRIDHYLGKETVQNLMVFRFANAIFEPLWNRRYIDHVQITAAEDEGVGHRGRYYEESGAIRDMFQNHLLQMLSLVAMEPPVAFDAKAVRDEKMKVLSAIRPYSEEEALQNAVRGQYGPGAVGSDIARAYRDEPNVEPQSNTDTFAAVKILIDNWRWTDVPFYIRSGKCLPKKITEIAIQFKQVPHLMFSRTPLDEFEPNVLAIRIQPNEGISLKFGAKQPGRGVHIRQVNMNFLYEVAFGVEPTTAYETLLLDALKGDPTLFTRIDAVEQSWKIAMPILTAWRSHPPTDFPNYQAGTWGPADADRLIAHDGRAWRRP